MSYNALAIIGSDDDAGGTGDEDVTQAASGQPAAPAAYVSPVSRSVARPSGAYITTTSTSKSGVKSTSYHSFTLPAFLGAAGYFFWPEHKYLGLLGGANIGYAVSGVMNGDKNAADLAKSLVNVGASTWGSLRNPNHPVLGYIGYGIAGTLVGDLIPGSKKPEVK